MYDAGATRRGLLSVLPTGLVTLAGCSSVRNVAGPSVREADGDDGSDLPSAARLARHVPDVGHDVYRGRELWVTVDGSVDHPGRYSVTGRDVQYDVRHGPTDLQRVHRRYDFLDEEPVATVAGYEIYDDGTTGYSADGSVRANPTNVTLSARELLDRCIAAETGDASLANSDGEVRTLVESVRAASTLDLYVLDGEVYGDERMRVPGARATAIGDSPADGGTLRREVGGVYPPGEVDEDGFREWVVEKIAPGARTVPTIARDGRVMRAFWKVPVREGETETETGPPEVVVWIAATEDGWRFTYPDEGVEGRRELVLPVDTRGMLEVTSRIEIVTLRIPELRFQTDAVPGTFAGGWVDPPGPGEYEIGCSGPCQWSYDADFTATLRVVSESAYREWLTDPR